jgi:hypothetical protein
MSKSTIAKLFTGSIAAVLVSVVLFVIAVGAILCTGTFVTSGGAITSFQISSVTPLMIALLALGLAALAVGGVGLFIAWIGALVNTARLPDHFWFLLLLLLGVFSFGWIAVLVYLLAGPEELAGPEPRAGATAGSSPAGTMAG